MNSQNECTNQPPTSPYGNEVLKRVRERGDIAKDVDDYYYYWPSGQGCLTAWHLRIIADELDRLNSDWDLEVQQSLRSD